MAKIPTGKPKIHFEFPSPLFVRVNDAIIFYYNKISHGVKVSFKNVSDEEYNLIMDEIENYICKRLYTK